jgi:restriction system protein
MYRETIVHNGLKAVRVVSARSQYELDQKIKAQMAAWNEQYQRKVAQEKKRLEKELKERRIEDAQALAERRTKAAESIQEELDTILTRSIHTSEARFDELKENASFEGAEPVEGEYLSLPREPSYSDEVYHPKMPFFTSLSAKRSAAFEAENRSVYEKDHAAWEDEVHRIEAANKETREMYESQLSAWNVARDAFYAAQDEANAEVDEFEARFNAGEYQAVVDFFDYAISSINVPIAYERRVLIDYDPETKQLVVEYFFPTADQLPSLKSVTYVKSRNDFKETQQTAAYMKRKYESVIYQLVMRIIKCVSSIDKRAHVVDTVALNGRVTTVDKATGKTIEPCVLSITTSLNDFREINLSAVDPKAWFKSSKGVSAASIANVTPVAPIVQMNRQDKRFIEGYGVEDALDESVNLAAMDWQDFENLIRELFEEEFSAGGGEVKITQASRDGGVDAVAFDPDPIRGGKIVIQAKRYTNTVGVSAVRDLYGTVMNEGAIKGILVTTSNYGNDAYEFASGKPLTLMNGANLLYLLERHGHKARIDLREAKETLGDATS